MAQFGAGVGRMLAQFGACGSKLGAVVAKVLNSWKEIAAHLGRGVRTVQRWERDFGLPVRRPSGRSRSAVVAVPAELDAWVHHAATRGAMAHDRNKQTHVDLRPRFAKLQDNVTTLQGNLDRLQKGLATARDLGKRYAERGGGFEEAVDGRRT